jgi:hypothetical protein
MPPQTGKKVSGALLPKGKWESKRESGRASRKNVGTGFLQSAMRQQKNLSQSV